MLKKYLIILILVSILLISGCGTPSKELSTSLLSKAEWNRAPVIKDIVFHEVSWFEDSKVTKDIRAKLYVTNDKNNIYMLLKIFDDDYYLGKNSYGEWADDRLFIVFDENNDNKFTEKDEDRVSIFVRGFQEEGTNHLVLPAAQGDWYYENEELSWEYDKEVNWEITNIPNQRFNGGKDMKEVYMSHSGDFKNGVIQDFIFEIKVPISVADPYDLQTKVGESIGIGIIYGNVYDGYGNFPKCDTTSDYDPTCLFDYDIDIIKKEV